MGVDAAQFRQALWAATCIVQFDFNAADNIPPLVVRVHKVDYLSMVASRIRKHMSVFSPPQSLTASQDEKVQSVANSSSQSPTVGSASPEQTPGTPTSISSSSSDPRAFIWLTDPDSQSVIAWHYPVGVLCGLQSGAEVWKLRVMYGPKLPDNILNMEAEAPVKSFYYDSLKQASYCLFGSTSSIMTLPTADAAKMWEAYVAHDLATHMLVRNKLFERAVVGCVITLHFEPSTGKLPILRKVSLENMSTALLPWISEACGGVSIARVSASGAVFVGDENSATVSLSDAINYLMGPDMHVRFLVVAA